MWKGASDIYQNESQNYSLSVTCKPGSICVWSLHSPVFSVLFNSSRFSLPLAVNIQYMKPNSSYISTSVCGKLIQIVDKQQQITILSLHLFQILFP